MSGGQKKARRQAAAQAADARRVTQDANEEALRTRQQAERGSSGRKSGSRGNRTLLMGMLSDRLQMKMGGGE
jgi:hypothetical protein